MGKPKCAITKEPCPAFFDDFCNFVYDDCPIYEQYRDSSYRYKPGESKSGAEWRLDDNCRHRGIKRSKEIADRDFIIK